MAPQIYVARITVLSRCRRCRPLFGHRIPAGTVVRDSPIMPITRSCHFSRSSSLFSLVYSLTSPFFCSAIRSFPISDRTTIKLGDFDAGSGGGPIWPQSDGADCASETLVLALIALTLLLPFLVTFENQVRMSPAKPSKTAETPVDELPFPGKLVEGKLDVQYLHL